MAKKPKVGIVMGSDSDSDGIPDWWEFWYFGDLVTAEVILDPRGATVIRSTPLSAASAPPMILAGAGRRNWLPPGRWTTRASRRTTWRRSKRGRPLSASLQGILAGTGG